MTVIGITGSIASGKSTVAKIIAKKTHPLFSADKVVADLYKKKTFINLLVKTFKLNKKKNIKLKIKALVKKNKVKFTILESIIHPIVRKEINNFLKIRGKTLILEIPLLIENKLNKYFDKVIFVDSKKNIRLKRYIKHSHDKKMFELLNKRQSLPTIKKKYCDYIITNNSSLAVLKKNIKKIYRIYE